MRILFWAEIPLPSNGGAGIFASRLVPALHERGHECIVVGDSDAGDGDTDEYRGTPVRRFPFRKALVGGVDRVIEAGQAVATLKRAYRPELVHILSRGPKAFFSLHGAAAHPAPLVVTVQGAWTPTPAPGTLLGRLLRKADWVTAVSDAVLAETIAAAPEIAARSSVIYHGIEPSGRPSHPLPLDPPSLLCAGRLVPEKGFDLALSALALLRGRWPRLRLVIAGAGPARGDLERLSEQLGLTAAVDFTGWVPAAQMPSLMDAATVVLIPSRAEGFGLIALEAAAMARPVVATRVGGLPEVVADGETGVLADPDECALARAVSSVLEDPLGAACMGEAARRRATERFSWDACVSAYEALYRRVRKEESDAGAV